MKLNCAFESADYFFFPAFFAVFLAGFAAAFLPAFFAGAFWATGFAAFFAGFFAAVFFATFVAFLLALAGLAAFFVFFTEFRTGVLAIPTADFFFETAFVEPSSEGEEVVPMISSIASCPRGSAFGVSLPLDGGVAAAAANEKLPKEAATPSACFARS